LVFRILDASAFYAGVPFGSSNQNYTTSLVFEEIKHIKKNHDALGILIETQRLCIKDPEVEFTSLVIKMAKKTGDFAQLSKEDISAIALCLNLGGELITDDFAVSNVSKNLNLKVYPVMTSGIKKVGNWVHYCIGCKKNFSKITICPLCGNNLRRKLLEGKAFTMSIKK